MSKGPPPGLVEPEQGGTVRALLRGLAVLEALNHRSVSTVESVATTTGLAKPTVVRLLATLVKGGYVQRLANRRGYELNACVQGLASGFRPTDALARTAAPLLSAFTAEHLWPVSLATLDVDAMRVLVSTVPESHFGVDTVGLYRRHAMLASATGRAYLAFCPQLEREAILALLRASSRVNNRPANDQQYVDQLLGSVRRDGYAVTIPVPGDPAIGFAVPVLRSDTVLGCITLRFLARAISETNVARRYLTPMRELAAKLALAAYADSEQSLSVEAD